MSAKVVQLAVASTPMLEREGLTESLLNSTVLTGAQSVNSVGFADSLDGISMDDDGSASDEPERPRSPSSASMYSTTSSTRAHTWVFQNTIAFWSSIFYVEGAALFAMGSLMMNHVFFFGQEHCWNLAWVEYPFNLGAVFFTLGNILLYFQVINAHSNHARGQRSYRLVALPGRDLGQWAALLQLLGGFLFNINTTLPLVMHFDTTTIYNSTYILSGVVGSLLFVAASVCEGEYNNWRRLEWKTLVKIEVLLSGANFLGSCLFVLGYAADFNRWASVPCKQEGHCVLYDWLVSGAFLAGSLLFLVTGLLSISMWKQQNFGLSFAQEIVGVRKHIPVDVKQHLMIVVYCANAITSWVLLGFYTADSGEGYEVDIVLSAVQDLLVYHAIMLLASALHTTPKRHPYDYLVWIMRIIALFGLCRNMYVVYRVAVRPFRIA